MNLYATMERGFRPPQHSLASLWGPGCEEVGYRTSRCPTTSQHHLPAQIWPCNYMNVNTHTITQTDTYFQRHTYNFSLTSTSRTTWLSITECLSICPSTCSYQKQNCAFFCITVYVQMCSHGRGRLSTNSWWTFTQNLQMRKLKFPPPHISASDYHWVIGCNLIITKWLGGHWPNQYQLPAPLVCITCVWCSLLWFFGIFLHLQLTHTLRLHVMCLLKYTCNVMYTCNVHYTCNVTRVM